MTDSSARYLLLAFGFASKCLSRKRATSFGSTSSTRHCPSNSALMNVAMRRYSSCVFGEYFDSLASNHASISAGIVSVGRSSASRLKLARAVYRAVRPSLTRQSLCHFRRMSTKYQAPFFS
ncbi:hypothetical protein BKK80_13985 [Cupriavidus malaysiensis]|uniref:Secreted protein n=1 Tax=Cupriavidus malaysiensis TaxID=367825 RepID=A0ABN4TP27_9BURK|nr:hypothetical protein BKK80_13985 [Cupriavidus malaysiensis]